MNQMTLPPKSLFAFSLTALVLLTPSVQAVNPPEPVAVKAAVGSSPMTMKQAMAHPDWLGRQPEQAFWGADSQHIYYQRKQAGSELRDWLAAPIQGKANNNALSLQEWDDIGAYDQVFSADKQVVAWVFAGNVFVKQIKSGLVSQLTNDHAQRSDLQFLTGNRLSWRDDWDFHVADLLSGRQSLLVSLKAENEPEAPKVAETFLAQEQQKLIGYVALQHKNASDEFKQQQQLQANNAALAALPVYVGEGKQINAAALSPDGRHLIVAVADEVKWRDESDIMPNYISASGNVEAKPVRRRVHEQKPEPETFYLVDIAKSAKAELAIKDLPGFDEDVLAAVKAENAKALGKTYQSVKKARDVVLLSDWAWDQSAIQWNGNGSQVAMMLRSWDNKDRWLVTVDLAKARFVPQHRLHDEAWVNYEFNEFGWLNQQDTLYFLSENTGYSQLYLKPLNGKVKALTTGEFEVSTPVLTKDDSTIYYRANPKHPGIYNIFKVEVATGKSTALTNLTGNLSFSLAPDENNLLVRYSHSLLPEELYVMPAQANAPLTRLTYTVSKELQQMALQAPKVIAVPSSHGKQPVYAKLYLLKDYQQGEKRRAVIFNHGAGYLQNSDLGWSNYFREFFFHNLLVQKGYVVLDMDYRASKGYGRDWRTAIYRQMGTPEIEDLQDGVKWLIANANVDEARIGTYGGSYGGFMTFMALFKQPELFKAGAALRPVGDWAYYNFGYTSNILNTPEVDPIAYRRSSPIYFTQGLKAQLLINAPMVDDNVFFQDSVRIVQRLIEQEINTFETAIFPVEPHGFVQPSSWLDEYRRIEKLFDNTL
jgi:dipeptidyl aminopeptidase/acylaminoacyl peptidase